MVPVYDAFHRNITNKKEVLSAFEDAVKIGKISCEKTRFMKAKFVLFIFTIFLYVINSNCDFQLYFYHFRASTSSENEDESDEVESGAFATTLWLEAVHRTIHNYFFE